MRELSSTRKGAPLQGFKKNHDQRIAISVKEHNCLQK